MEQILSQKCSVHVLQYKVIIMIMKIRDHKEKSVPGTQNISMKLHNIQMTQANSSLYDTGIGVEAVCIYCTKPDGFVRWVALDTYSLNV